MIRGHKHASPYELASLSLGALRARRAARIDAHITTCMRCTELRQQVDAVPGTLASAAYPPMPPNMVSRIEVAINVEVRQRLADMPATEADRGALPAPRRRARDQRGWRLPGLSVLATRVVAAAGAVVVAGVGSYAAVTATSGPGPRSAPAGAAGAPAAPQQMSMGPAVTYGQPGKLHTIHSYRSSANFNAAHLKTEVIDAVHTAQARGPSAAPSSVIGSAAPSHVQSNAAAGSAGAKAPSPGQLSGCLSGLAPGRVFLLIEIAKYDGKAATIVVAAATTAFQAEAWVVGTTCSPTNTDVLAHILLGHL